MDEQQITNRHPWRKGIGAAPVMVKLGNSDGSVTIDGFNIHRMAVVTAVTDGYITDLI